MNYNMSFTNYAIGGGSLVQTEGRFYIGGSIDTIIAENDFLNILVLSGGYNDSQDSVNNPIGTYSETDYSGNYDITTILGSLETMLFKAIKKYSDKFICYVITYNINSQNIWVSNKKQIKKVLEKWGIPYFDMQEETHIFLNNSIPIIKTRFFRNNDIHPNQFGHATYSNAFGKWLERHYFDYAK